MYKLRATWKQNQKHSNHPKDRSPTLVLACCAKMLRSLNILNSKCPSRFKQRNPLEEKILFSEIQCSLPFCKSHFRFLHPLSQFPYVLLLQHEKHPFQLKSLWIGQKCGSWLSSGVQKMESVSRIFSRKTSKLKEPKAVLGHLWRASAFCSHTV